MANGFLTFHGVHRYPGKSGMIVNFFLSFIHEISPGFFSRH